MGAFDTASKKIHNILEITTKGQKTMAESLPVVIASNQGAVPSSVASGGNVVEGATADAAIITDTTGSMNGKLRGLVKWAFERMPASLGQALMAASLPVAIASNQSTLATSVAAGDNATEGNTSDAAVITDTTGTLSGKLRGLVKWAFERMPASLGQKTMAASLPVAIASDQTVFSAAATLAEEFDGAEIGVNTTPYTSGDQMGNKLQLTSLTTTVDKEGITLESVVITDQDKQNTALELILFDDNPAASTLSNNSPADVHVDDRLMIIGVVKIAATDYVDCGSRSVAVVYPRIMMYKDTAHSFYASLICRGTPTHTGLSVTMKLIGKVG